MENSGRVAILLATYNGEKYLDEQLRSIFEQTYRDFVLIVRDDGSTDRTPEILAQWSKSHPDKLRVVFDDFGNLRSSANFSLLMQACEEPYFAFCDQDDLWLPNKVELVLSEVQHLERIFGKAKPILVHTDLKIVDQNLRVISPSLFAHLHWNANKSIRLRSLLFNNIVVGCTVIGNKALLELARPIPSDIPHHDWWVALIAASCGVLSTVNEATILYRQHDLNQIGAGPRLGRRTLRDARYFAQQPSRSKLIVGRALRAIQSRADLLVTSAGHRMSRRNRDFLLALSLPRARDGVVRLPWRIRMWLFIRFLILYARLLPIVLYRCVPQPHRAATCTPEVEPASLGAAALDERQI